MTRTEYDYKTLRSTQSPNKWVERAQEEQRTNQQRTERTPRR